MNPIPKLLSKTKLMRGYRCHKCIYLTIHHPELEAPITAETQALFDQGNQVGEKAREYFPGGILVDNKPWDFIGALNKTRELIQNGTTLIYEAAFEYMGCYARADIIQYSDQTKRWNIIEVKSSTKVKPEHYDDVGLQAWIIAKSGLPIESIHVLHLNSHCHYPDLQDLFTQVDVTQDIRERYLTIKPKINEIVSCIRHPNMPDIDIGQYCLQPTECGFKQVCWKKIPEYSLFNLPGLRDKKWDLYAEGMINIDDARLTEMNELNELQKRIIECYKTGQRYLNPEKIKMELSAWTFPLVFLDFETINPAIPRYENCSPFEHVPFQFSVHIMSSLDSEIIHKEFLHDNAGDPRPALIPALLEACQQQGSIVAYFGKFESDRIKALSDYSPSQSEALNQLIERIVDPLILIRENIYNNAFQGSFSLKKVAPALLGRAFSYEGMEIANGNAAQRAYEELISDGISDQRKNKLKTAMLEYCKKDTYVMVELVKLLYSY
jgi:hypothetical protein